MLAFATASIRSYTRCWFLLLLLLLLAVASASPACWPAKFG